MAADTLFDLASISKVVGTATAAMALVEDGKLDLDEPVARRIPAFGAVDKRTITIADLLTHVSGLPAYMAASDLEARHGPGPNPEAVIAAIASSPLLHPVRGGYKYS
jgi:CubicO group peptidase (beta-lactamase class C family)